MLPNSLGLEDPTLNKIKTHRLDIIKINESIPEKDFEKIICPLISAESPKTPRTLNIFEPTTLPIAILPFPLIKDATVTANSGRDVPIAARLMPIIGSGILKTSETLIKPFIKSSEP